ncbi:MAG TPA: DapH/DapD/GlmU-related protein [Bacteroidales bacterium]|nr:DapH/DapD/GlmU-related protein [Bacteroidales bacterium]
MMILNTFIDGFSSVFALQRDMWPWEITGQLRDILEQKISTLKNDFVIKDGIAIHKSSIIEAGAVIKGPAYVGPNCFISANAYFREGVFLEKNVKIGPGCEIKNSIIFSDTAVAHFNYIGNSIIGRKVNFEAGSIAANHYNERIMKEISVLYQSEIVRTGVNKFGSLVGDNCKIGANAVLSPGTILEKNSVVRRLELVEQVKVEL